jgi:SPP1 gp7 family putative phage head morphogenesis protein
MLVQDIIKHRVYLEMQKNRINKNALTYLLSSIDEFDKILKFLVDNDYNKLPENIKKEIDKIITEIFNKYEKEATDGIIEVAKYENLYNSNLVKNLVISKVAVKSLSTDQIETFLNKDVLNLKFDKSIKNQSEQFREIFKANIETGIKDRLGVEKISNNLRINLNMKKTHLETLTRTVFQNTMNLTNDEIYKRNKEFLNGLKRTAVLDQLTTDICRKNNGKIYTIEESKGVLPAHYNCRSFWIPVIDKDFLIPAQYKDFAKTQKDDIFKSESEKAFKTSKTMTIEEMKKREQ